VYRSQSRRHDRTAPAHRRTPSPGWTVSLEAPPRPPQAMTVRLDRVPWLRTNGQIANLAVDGL